jgi:transcriptional regulator with GAF, ATPase, and Fis domain
MPERRVDETLTLEVALPRNPGRANAVVRVMGAPSAPHRFRLAAGASCRLGSASDCDVVIAEPTVSRAHAELTLAADGVVVRDLGSRNGTFYLGQRVEKAILALGASVQLGSVTVVLDADVASANEPLEYGEPIYDGLVGYSRPMRRLFATLARMESSLTTVLVEGESGVGKELVARAVHNRSPLASKAFVALNCGALPHDLVGSELFGHRKGAFTGATDARRGAFETAAGGTLFLDEIGELPLELQPMLLRALESGEVRAIGGDASKHVQVRVIAATNRDLEADVRAGRFREDLFYRLAVVRLRVPALRERLEDIEPLAQLFARELGIERGLDAALIEELKRRGWPGNIRELRNTVQAYVALGVLPEPTRSKAATLELALREVVNPRMPYVQQKDALVDQFTTLYLEALLEMTGGNQTIASRWAGLDRGYLGRLLARYPGSKTRRS